MEYGFAGGGYAIRNIDVEEIAERDGVDNYMPLPGVRRIGINYHERSLTPRQLDYFVKATNKTPD